jgi:NitT/TauT family transport system substrate-binding protein
VALGLLAAACAPSAARGPERAPTPAAVSSGLATPVSAAQPAAPPPLETIKMAFASDAMIYSPHFVAIEKGYYAEEGIELEILRVGGGVATPALISGEVPYSTSAGTALSAILKGAPLKVIYTHVDRPGYELWSGVADVRALPDIVGRSIAVQSRGDTMEIATRMVLRAHGLDPNAVGYVSTGPGAQRLVALQTGAAAAAVLTITDIVQLGDTLPQRHRLADMREHGRLLYTGLATNGRELQEHPDRVRRVLRGTIKGREYYKAIKDESIDITQKYSDRPRLAHEADYDELATTLTEDGSMPVDVQQRDAAVRAELNEVAVVPPPEQMYDYRIVRELYRELRASGWQPTR